MYQPTQTQIDNALSACFSGEVARECPSCPAHPSNGGPCCFGDEDQYDSRDDDCQKCIHRSECREQIVFNPQGDYRLRDHSAPVQLGRRVGPQSTSVAPRVNVPAPTVNVPIPTVHREESQTAKEILVESAKDAAWGGLTGALQVVTRIFERGRPRTR